jgi:hypothetical protein
MRVFLPSTLPALAEALRAGHVGQQPGYAVTPALREAYASGDEEELEYSALTEAANCKAQDVYIVGGANSAGQAAMLQDSIDAAESAAGHPLKRGEVSRYWSAKARDYIERSPAAWLRLLALKLRTFWSAFQYDDLSIITILREQKVTLPGIYFGLVAAFALPAMVLGWKAVPAGRWVVRVAIEPHLADHLRPQVQRFAGVLPGGVGQFGPAGGIGLWRHQCPPDSLEPR